MQKIIFCYKKIKKYRKCPALRPPDLKPIFETFYIGPNVVFILVKERVRSELRRFKNSLLKPVLKTFASDLTCYLLFS